MASTQGREGDADKPDKTCEPDKTSEPSNAILPERLNESSDQSELDKPERLAQMNKRFNAGLLLYDNW